MKSLLSNSVVLMIGTFCLYGYAGEAPKELSLAGAAEAALHRIQTLVVSRPPKQIDAGYRDHFHQLSVRLLERHTLDEPKFYILAEQYPSEDGTKNQVELWLNPDAQGATKWKHNVILGAAPAKNPPVWPIDLKDATTLIEPAIHLILETHEINTDLNPYYEGLKSFSISQIVRETADTVAQIDFELADPAAPLLRMWVTVEGVLTTDHYQFVPRVPEAGRETK